MFVSGRAEREKGSKRGVEGLQIKAAVCRCGDSCWYG